MNVIAFNGSPRAEGNTHHLLQMLRGRLEAAGVTYRQIDVCAHRPRGCIACYGCARTKDGRCAITDDPMNEWIEAMRGAQGVILASPTYFCNVSAEMKALIDRAGLVAKVNEGMLARKVGAAVVAVRRAGAITTFDALNKFFLINGMIVPGSTYWNLGVGMAPGDVTSDDEGVKTMEYLGDTMAWLLERLR